VKNFGDALNTSGDITLTCLFKYATEAMQASSQPQKKNSNRSGNNILSNVLEG